MKQSEALIDKFIPLPKSRYSTYAVSEKIVSMCNLDSLFCFCFKIVEDYSVVVSNFSRRSETFKKISEMDRRALCGQTPEYVFFYSEMVVGVVLQSRIVFYVFGGSQRGKYCQVDVEGLEAARRQGLVRLYEYERRRKRLDFRFYSKNAACSDSLVYEGFFSLAPVEGKIDEICKFRPEFTIKAETMMPLSVRGLADPLIYKKQG